MAPIVGSPQERCYRNKAQYPVRQEGGKVIAGFFAKRSHRVIPCPRCALQPAFFEDIVAYTCRFMEEKGVSAYEEEEGRGLVRHIYIRYGEISGEVMVCLVINGPSLPHAQQYIDGLLLVCPQVVSVILNKNTRRDNVILGEDCSTIYGSLPQYRPWHNTFSAFSPIHQQPRSRLHSSTHYRLPAERQDWYTSMFPAYGF